MSYDGSKIVKKENPETDSIGDMRVRYFTHKSAVIAEETQELPIVNIIGR